MLWSQTWQTPVPSQRIRLKAASEIHQAYKRAAKTMHPDGGGNGHAFQELAKARDALMHPASKKDG